MRVSFFIYLATVAKTRWGARRASVALPTKMDARSSTSRVSTSSLIVDNNLFRNPRVQIGVLEL